MPLIVTSAPSLASARAIASPIPLVEPVTRAWRLASDMEFSGSMDGTLSRRDPALKQAVAGRAKVRSPAVMPRAFHRFVSVAASALAGASEARLPTVTILSSAC